MSEPFIREIYLPNCALVGPHHRLERDGDAWAVIDTHPYEDHELTDEEFVAIFNSSGDVSRTSVPAPTTLEVDSGT